jgi:hypothetical protein
MMRKFRDTDRVEPVPCARCRGSGLEPSLADAAAPVIAGASHLADAARIIAADPELRRHATALLAGVTTATPPDGVVADDELNIRRGAE